MSLKEYREQDIWRKARELGMEVRKVIAERKLEVGDNVIIRCLHDVTGELPVTLVIGSTESGLQDTMETIRCAYDLAHRAEYLLFLSLLWRYLPYGDVRALTRKARLIKFLLTGCLEELRRKGWEGESHE